MTVLAVLCLMKLLGVYGSYPVLQSEIQQAVNDYTSVQWDESDTKKRYGDISELNTSLVTDMRFLFNQKTSFNKDISGWDVSRVTNMEYMFNYALPSKEISVVGM